MTRGRWRGTIISRTAVMNRTRSAMESRTAAVMRWTRSAAMTAGALRHRRAAKSKAQASNNHCNKKLLHN